MFDRTVMRIAAGRLDAISVRGSVRFDPSYGGVTFMTLVAGLNDPKYVDPGTTVANMNINTPALVVSSVEEWRGGVSALIQEHQGAITRDLLQDVRRLDRKRLAITDLDARDPTTATTISLEI